MGSLAFAACIDFVQAVEQQLQYETEISPDLLPRLSECCTKIVSPAHVNFHFFKDMQGLNTIEGEISCEVVFTCQRCSKEFRQVLTSNFSSTPDKQKACSLRIEDKLDLVELNEQGQFELLNFLEDCLMLEIPFVPKHEEGDPECQESTDLSFGKIDMNKENPFARLAELKEKLSK